eukprot:PhM_4_TR4626/c0_g1_i1/m.43105
MVHIKISSKAREKAIARSVSALPRTKNAATKRLRDDDEKALLGRPTIAELRAACANPTLSLRNDVPVKDNVLVEQFPELRSCGDILHEETGTRLDPDNIANNVRLGLNTCGTCARKIDERFRCKQCNMIAYCCAGHQAADRGFHNTVCDALVSVNADEDVGIETAHVGAVLGRLSVGCLAHHLDEAPVSTAHLFADHLVAPSNVVSREAIVEQCLSFVFSPMGRRAMEYLTFPLTLWSCLAQCSAQRQKPFVVDVINAGRGECEFPTLWSLMPTSLVSAFRFFGSQVPKSFHEVTVDGRSWHFRGAYHEAPLDDLEPATVLFLPHMGLTTGRYDWEPTLQRVASRALPGMLVVVTAGFEEELDNEINVFQKALGWTVVEQPRFNRFASTKVRQSTTLANDVFRTNYCLAVMKVGQ